MKKLMILGASYSQIPLIETAKQMGIYTITASIPGEYPGFEAADEAAYVDISNPEAVLEAARRLEIDGIATCGLDLGMAAIGLVSEKMGLKGPSALAARTVSNKFEMKQAFIKGGVQTARFRCIHNKKELETAMEELPFPVILKAVDQMGSRGIFRCNTPEEVRENYPRTMASTKKDYCLLEEFIEGTLFGTEAMIRDGKMVYCLPDNTEAYQSFVPTPVGHSVPFDREDTLGAQAREQVEKAIRAAGLDNCPVNCDLIFRDDKVYVVEITGRPGATCLPEMVGIYYGINYYEAIVRLALDMEVESMFREDMVHTASISHTLTSQVTGTVKQIVNENEEAEDLVDLSFNIEAGDQIRKYENGRDRLGQVIIKGPALKGCRDRLEQVLNRIRIELV